MATNSFQKCLTMFFSSHPDVTASSLSSKQLIDKYLFQEFCFVFHSCSSFKPPASTIFPWDLAARFLLQLNFSPVLISPAYSITTVRTCRALFQCPVVSHHSCPTAVSSGLQHAGCKDCFGLLIKFKGRNSQGKNENYK